MISWINERFPPPLLFQSGWNDLLHHEITPRLGVADASIILAASELKNSVVLLQDGPLHGWCLKNRLEVRTCVQVAAPDRA